MRIWFFTFLALTLTLTEGHEHGRTTCKYARRQTAACGDGGRYRSVDGQCNNLDNPTWGSVSSKLDRMVAAVYDDGVAKPRTQSVSGTALPSPREISVKCHTSKNVTARVTLMLMQWGQFLDHDITLTPHSAETCPCDSTSTECFKIPMQNDEYFKTRSCFEFSRSSGTMATDSIHKKPIRQQSNNITAFIDASNVYGSSTDQMDALRDVDGLLKDTDLTGSEKFLPAGSDDSCRLNASKIEYCFLAGDVRVNEQPALVAMHTIFMREHNRIAKKFNAETTWSAERIYQETRKIVGAMIQYITYNEFLPLVLGSKVMKEHDLDQSGYKYNRKMKPDITNAFATAAFRFGHTLIPEELNMETGTLEFRNLFSRPSTVLNSFKDLTSTVSKQEALGADKHFAHSVTRHLFQMEEQTGLDLIALNIQRGRDHGLPSYNTYRKICGLQPLTSLDQLYPDKIAQSVYSSIEDVDLFSAGMSESLVSEGLVGPTFACILGRQFKRLKYGDRFFYLNNDNRSGFTKRQLEEINKIRLSRIICDNVDFKNIQEKVFLPVGKSNLEVGCSQLPKLDLSAWIGKRRG